MARCFLCDPPSDMPDDEIAQHLWDAHDFDMEREMERWPDGSPVVIDQSLEPGDFRG